MNLARQYKEKTDDNIDPLEPLPSHRGWPIDFWSDYPPVRRASNFPLKLGVDVIQNPDNYTIEASLPGFSAGEIDVTVDDGVLRIAAQNSSDETNENGRYLVRERRYGKYFRAIRVPDGVDVDSATTGFKDGVLRIELPKNDGEPPKRLPISA